MSVAGYLAVTVAAVLVAALAFYLVWVVVLLRRLIDTLGKVTFGVRAIAHRVGPVGPVLTEVNAGLGGVADAWETLADDLRSARRAS